jgi:hypothetical protein
MGLALRSRAIGWDGCEAIHIQALNCFNGSSLLWLYNRSEKSSAAMNWWKRVWEQVWGTQSRQAVTANEPAWVLPHWSAVPEEWVLARLIRG